MSHPALILLIFALDEGQRSSVNRPFSLFDWVSPQVRRNAFSRAMMTIIGCLHCTQMDSSLKKKKKPPLEFDSLERMKIKALRGFPGNILISMIWWWRMWTGPFGQFGSLIRALVTLRSPVGPADRHLGVFSFLGPPWCHFNKGTVVLVALHAVHLRPEYTNWQKGFGPQFNCLLPLLKI